jgi:hypothetical protein
MRSLHITVHPIQTLCWLRTGMAQALTLTGFLLTILALSSGHASAQGTIIARDTTFNAISSGTVCAVGEDGAETCSDVSLHVAPGKFNESMMVCIEVTTYAPEGEFYEEGCADVATTFTMDLDQLSWGMLAATPVDLYANVCEGKVCDYAYTRTLVLGASWSAAGEMTRIHETLGDPHGPCTVTAKIDGFVREMTTTVTIDDTSLVWWGNLQTLDDKTMRRTNCG